MGYKKGNVGIIFGGGILILFLFLALFFSLTYPKGPSGGVTNSPEEISSSVILSIANLPESSDLNFDSYEEYVKFASKVNSLIEILNGQSDWFDLSNFDNSYNAYGKLSKSIEDVDKKLTKWGPLVNNYNEVIVSAKLYKDDTSEENKRGFYYASTKFGFEFSIISGAVFYTASYQTVGTLYRASGLSGFARTCPTCVSKGLSVAHWEIRNELGELSSTILDKIKGAKFNEKKLDKINLNDLVNQFRKTFWSGIGFTSQQIQEDIYYLEDSWEQIKNTNEYDKASGFLDESINRTKGLIDENTNKLKNWFDANL